MQCVDYVRRSFELMLAAVDVRAIMLHFLQQAMEQSDGDLLRQVLSLDNDPELLPSVLEVALGLGELRTAADLFEYHGLTTRLVERRCRKSLLAMLCECVPKAAERSFFVALMQLSLDADVAADCAGEIANRLDMTTGLAPLHVAVTKVNHVAIGFLVGKQGVDVNVRERERGWVRAAAARSFVCTGLHLF